MMQYVMYTSYCMLLACKTITLRACTIQLAQYRELASSHCLTLHVLIVNII